MATFRGVAVARKLVWQSCGLKEVCMRSAHHKIKYIFNIHEFGAQIRYICWYITDTIQFNCGHWPSVIINSWITQMFFFNAGGRGANRK